MGEQSLCLSLHGKVPFCGFSKAWLQLCSSNTLLFCTLDSSSTGCVLGALKLPCTTGSPTSGQRPFALLAEGRERAGAAPLPSTELG